MNGTTTTFDWSDGGGLRLLLSTKTGSDRTYLIYGPGGEPVEQVAASGVAVWLHHDQLGSVRLATDAATGTEVSRWTFTAYGAPVGSLTSGTQPLLGYAGQYTDAETGYQYLRARFYDPATAGFLTRDPALAVTAEPYGYTGDNPANRIDPTGLNWLGDAWDATGGKVATAVYEHADVLSTITGWAATGAYALCAVTSGVGCAAGTVLSVASSGLSLMNAHRACMRDHQNCAEAVVASGIDLLGTFAGAAATERAADGIVGVMNPISRDIYLSRQAGTIGALGGIATAGLDWLVGCWL